MQNVFRFKQSGVTANYGISYWIYTVIMGKYEKLLQEWKKTCPKC